MKRFNVAMTCKSTGKFAQQVIEASSISALFYALSISKDMNDFSEIDITALD